MIFTEIGKRAYDLWETSSQQETLGPQTLHINELRPSNCWVHLEKLVRLKQPTHSLPWLLGLMWPETKAVRSCYLLSSPWIWQRRLASLRHQRLKIINYQTDRTYNKDSITQTSTILSRQIGWISMLLIWHNPVNE